MIPTWMNPLPCNGVDARLLLVIKYDDLSNTALDKEYADDLRVLLIKCIKKVC